jgi:hypothetical protein
MNYTIFNYKGDVLNESVSQAELDSLIQSDEFNCFQWDITLYDNFIEQNNENPEVAFNNFRVYKPIVE